MSTKTNPPGSPAAAPELKVVRTAALPWVDALTRGAYDSQRKDLGGLSMLRAGVWQLGPGKKSFPLHRHHVAEEALFVLAGRGAVRTEHGTTSVGPGDYVAFPAGGPAHQLINEGDEPLVYLGLSVNPSGADLVDYPESGKIGATAGGFPPTRRFVFSTAQAVDYFHDDPDANA